MRESICYIGYVQETLWGRKPIRKWLLVFCFERFVPIMRVDPPTCELLLLTTFSHAPPQGLTYAFEVGHQILYLRLVVSNLWYRVLHIRPCKSARAQHFLNPK